jgi:uncharacterized glyoxalase superfamily protein PhnB
MKFETIVPIFYAADVVKSLNYYVDTLCFEEKWEWDDPPTFGGVRNGDVQIFFCKNCQGNPGTWISVFVDNVDAYYETIKAKGANILSPPQDMEWGIREMLVEDPDGHKIRFGCGIE